MNKKQIKNLLELLLVPVLLMVLGLVLLVNPDSASVLIAKIIGWGLVIVGAGKALSNLPAGGSARVGSWLWAAGFLIFGIYILKNPLILAKSVGRILGILLIIDGVHDLYAAHKQTRKLPISDILTAAIGAVLLFLPMTTSRLFFSICGLVLLCIGGALLFDRLRGYKKLEEPEDSNIIDADA